MNADNSMQNSGATGWFDNDVNHTLWPLQRPDTLHRHHQNTRRGNILWKNGVHSSRSLWRLIEYIQRSIEVQHPTCTLSFCINLSSANWLHTRWNQFISLHFVQCFFVSFPVMWLVGFVELKGKATGICVPLMLTARIVFLHTHRWSVRKKQPFCVHPLQEPGSDCIDFCLGGRVNSHKMNDQQKSRWCFEGEGWLRGRGIGLNTELVVQLNERPTSGSIWISSTTRMRSWNPSGDIEWISHHWDLLLLCLILTTVLAFLLKDNY